MLTYDKIVQGILQLSVRERVRLLHVIADTLEENAAPPAKMHNILEFEGIAVRLADDVDPQDHINYLRGEWDDLS